MHKSISYERELRLLTPSHFQTVFSNPPVKAVTAHVTMLATPNELGHPRIGVTVSKKRAKRAVDRNRIKRQIRETFRLRQHKIPAFDIVIIAKQGIVEQDNAALRDTLNYLWRKLAKRCEQYQSRS
ncbi:ribonuclease P protein component [Idiomarina sp. PL1-037]|uniref:ribonuclease P protein component n=1 Tax=unclassified Idiomarina TaxID=2614829 RepID=UPI00294AAF40|nr:MULTISPECIES: ribonuclease P protein component [unclassified Idiomarina]MDV6328507.1 ribonuclease P protein component [Idiomarina sp. Sol25]WQC53029.1 ribonuclease P protein component [Idiomarina sp. PL1-037]